MPVLGQLSGTDGATTIITRPYTPELLVIGSIDTDVPLSRITVTVGGEVVQEVSGQANIQAMAKYLMECLLGADVKIGMMLKVADGFLAGQNVEIKLTQTGTSTASIYGFSDNKGAGLLVRAGQETIQASSNIELTGFTALFIPTTNFQDAQVVFADGHSERLSQQELAALFALENQADADGLLAGVLCVDNKPDIEGVQPIQSITVFSTSGGTLQLTALTMI
jgi:hypothetical protein